MYLGHVISESGVRLDPGKTEDVSLFPRPENRKNIKQFLGLVGYYRRFIPNFTKIAIPLNSLLRKKERFISGDTPEIAFTTLKKILCIGGYAKSQGSIGKDLPIAYASRSLIDAERNYTTTEKVLLAMVYAVKQFRPYLYDRKFTLIRDHKALV